MVQLPNTATYPKAVMIVFPNASLAFLAVFGPVRLLFGAIITEPSLGQL